MTGLSAGEHHHATLPQGAERFQGTQAGLVTRCAANAIDFVVTLAVLGGIYLAVTVVSFLWSPRSFSFPSPALGLAVIVGGAVTSVYFAACWMTSGRTYGDYVLGLRVLSGRGRKLRPGLALLRALACAAFPIGLFWVAVNRGNRSLQDLVLRTRVVYDWPEQLP